MADDGRATIILITGLVCLFGGAVLVAVNQYRTRRSMYRVKRMLEAAMDGTFQESVFDESLYSALESQLAAYLSASEISARRTAQEKEQIKTLVADISHQTKTPIANMLLYAQLLGENKSLDEEAKNIVLQIEEQTNKLNFLIQSLIKTSRLESGTVSVAPESSRVDELIAKLDFAEAARQKGVSFSVGEVPPLTAFFDRKWTLEALANIVDNALKYTPAGGSVKVEVMEYEMFVRIDIKDTGIGMTEDETAKIFSRFYRSPVVSGEEGVGIGLYLVREILSREGGYVKVASRLGEGSVFSVFLVKQDGLSDWAAGKDAY